QQVLSHAPLMDGQEVRESEDLLDGFLEMEEVARAGVGLVPLHQTGPLPVGHGRGPGVGEEVDEDGFRRDLEQAESALLEEALALLPGEQMDLLYYLHTPRLGK